MSDPRPKRFTVYRTLTLGGIRWRWRLRAGNGEIIASGQAYKRKADALRAVALLDDLSDALLEIED